MIKTIENGYFKIESIDKWLHFSMLCWVILKKECGLDIARDLTVLSEDISELEQIDLMSKIVFSAIKANDLEEGNEVDYNEYNVVNWSSKWTEEEWVGINNAMMASMQLSDEGKGKAKK